ncbi:MAG: type II secretion system protein GspL [Thermodesulfobacteriota bacterium]
MGDRILAIDWRTHAVFGAVLNRGRKGYRVVCRAQAPIDPNADRMGVDRLVPFERVLQSLAEQTEIAGTVCSIVLPTAWFQFHRMHLPFRKHQDIASVLPFEIASHLVGAIDEMALAFDGVAADGDGSYVVAAAIPKICIDAIEAAAAAHRLQIRRIAPASDGLGRVIAGCDRDASKREWLLVLVEGTEDVSLVGVSKGCVRFIRCLPLAIGSTVDSVGDDWLGLEGEIRRTLISENENATEGRFEPEAAVVLIEADGPSWKTPGEGVSLDIGVPVLPLTSVFCRDLPDGTAVDEWLWFRLHEMAPGDGIDVHPETRRLRGLWSSHRNRILWSTTLAGLCLLLTFGSIGMDIVLTTRTLRSIDRTIAARFHQVFPPDMPMVDPVQQVRNRNRELADDPLMAFAGNPTPTADVLTALIQDVMGNLDVVLSRLSLDGEKLSIGGNAADFESVYEMKRRFERSGIQTTATIQSASQDAAQNRVLFSMDITRFRP